MKTLDPNDYSGPLHIAISNLLTAQDNLTLRKTRAYKNTPDAQQWKAFDLAEAEADIVKWKMVVNALAPDLV